MTSNDSLSSDVILRYCLDNLSPDDQAQLEAWRQRDAASAARLEQLRAELRRRPEVFGESDIARGIVAVTSVTQPDKARRTSAATPVFRISSRNLSEPARTSAWPRRVLPAALGCIAIGLAALVWFADAYVTGLPGDDRIARQYTTGTGEQLTVALADESQVTLAPQTQLAVAKGFGISNRRIHVDGDAEFHVVSASALPFEVVAGDVVTRVLGTRFRVARYPDDSTLTVTVTSGRVSVQPLDQEPVTLAAGTMGTVTENRMMVESVGTDTPSVRWVDGVLEFRAVPLKDMLRTLSRWYGVRFKVADSALATHAITTFVSYTNTADLIRGLETLLGVTATSQATTAGPVVTLRRRQHTRPPVLKRDGDVFIPRTEVGR